MTREDPQKLAYPQTYPPTLDSCVCGHLVTVHMLSESTKERMYCSSWVGGRCRCKRYEAVPDDVPISSKTRPLPLPPVEYCRYERCRAPFISVRLSKYCQTSCQDLADWHRKRRLAHAALVEVAE